MVLQHQGARCGVLLVAMGLLICPSTGLFLEDRLATRLSPDDVAKMGTTKADKIAKKEAEEKAKKEAEEKAKKEAERLANAPAPVPAAVPAPAPAPEGPPPWRPKAIGDYSPAFKAAINRTETTAKALRNASKDLRAAAELLKDRVPPPAPEKKEEVNGEDIVLSAAP